MSPRPPKPPASVVPYVGHVTGRHYAFPLCDQATYRTAAEVPDDLLVGRQARCCTDDGIKPSLTARTLPGFEYRGAGSFPAEDICRCGMARVAHIHADDIIGGSRINKEPVSCPRGFTPRGPWTYDSYYCGHAGND